MKPILTADKAVEDIKDGATLMVAGFMGCGNAFTLVDALIRKGTKELNLITSDTAYPDVGVGRIICQNRAATLTASHIGTNPVSGAKMNSGELKVTLVPQGTLAERMRAKGAGLGGVLTPTGIGTAVEEGKQKLNIGGKDFLLELPLGAEFALIKAEVADKYGNAYLPAATKNMAVAMAMAADHVILEAEKIVEAGELDPDRVTIPGVFISVLVQATLPASNLQLKA
jgi:acetate CoA/acetoacetate CoA-transferase alpha subunit